MSATASASSSSSKDFEEPPPSKRRRVSTRNATQDPFEPRSEDLWFRDGTVIVAAVGMSFKVHAGILERHSPVFQELLEVKARQQVEKAEGCHVLRVEDDGAVLEELFLILYDGGKRCVSWYRNRKFSAKCPCSSGFFDRTIPIDFMKLHRVTLLATKYRVAAVIDEAVARMEAIFPVVLDDKRLQWDSYFRTDDTPISGMTGLRVIPAVALARAIDSENPPAFAAMALYFCTNVTMKALFDGHAAMEPLRLPPDDLRLCLIGRETLVKRSQNVHSSIVDACPDDVDCQSMACRVAREDTFRFWATRGVLSSPLALSPTSWDSGSLKKLCKVCRPLITTMYEARRREAFNKLGEIFNVPSWPHGAPKQ